MVSAATALTVVVSLVSGSPAFAAPRHDAKGPSSTAAATSVPLTPVKTVKARTPSQTDGAGETVRSGLTLPAAATGDVPVTGVTTNAGSLPVTLTAATAPAGRALTQESAADRPASVRVNVADAATAKKLGLSGVVMALSRTDRGTVPGTVHASFGYSSFANAYGADFGARLHVVELPGCALTTPSVAACQTPIDVASTNNQATQAVSADVAVGADTSMTAAAPMVLALASSSVSQAADWTATSLKPSYAWTAGDPAGDFDYSYPFDAPDSIGGPAPSLKLQYSSQSVDAQTLSQNGQTSWVGEGWDLQTGYIERSYRSCKDDNVSGLTAVDNCWFSNNATMVFEGQSAQLVYDDATHVWHAADDQALKIDQVYGTGTANTPGDNGTYNHEYWRVTTQDGTQYFFGINHRYSGDTASTNGALTERAYGDNSGEPCYNATFANAGCQQGYRWNLDYVVDPRHNSMTYVYDKFSGVYGANGNTYADAYDLSATVNHIDYGTRAGSEGSASAPMRIQFTVNGRCTGACAQTDYPDTPWDQYCAPGSTSCAALPAPVFWNPNKLSAVTAQLWNGTAYRNVDRWDLAYTFPASGDYITPAGNDTSPNLWLQSVTHTGYNPDGTSLAEPAVNFGGTRMANRVFWGNTIGVAPYMHYRITSVTNGAGGQTLVAYNGSDCDGTFTPTVSQNPHTCFPQYIKPQIAAAGWTWFQKYTVQSVTDQDLTGGSPDEVTTYAYSTAGSSTNVLWHHDDAEWVSMTYRSWTQWRGYPTVTTTKGAAGGTQTTTTSLYYRGMNGDRTSSGWNTRTETLTDSQGSGIADPNPLAGHLREQTRFDGTTVLSSTITTPTVTQTASRAAANQYTVPVVAYMVTDTDQKTRTWLQLSSSWRWTETQTTYNGYKLPTLVHKLNDTSISTDDTCASTTYVTPDTTAWFVDFPARELTTDCAATPGDADYVSGTQTYYDGSATVGATPTQGLETKTEDLASVVSGAQTWKQHDRTDYDANGRDTATYDGNNNKTATAYTPASGGPVTSTTETNANQWTSTTTYDPGHGSVLSYSDVNGKVTTAQFDPLGRLLKVFAPHTPAITTPDLQYTYALSNTAPNYIETQKLGPTGAQIASFAIFDGQYRLRQNQDPTPVANGGRWITDTTYDSRGLKAHNSQFYNNTTAPSGVLGTFTDSAVPSQDRYAFDALERQTADVFWSNGVQQWQTTHAYDGDREAEVPPAGGVVTQKILDARGNTTQLRQFTSSDLSGSYQATNYTYDLDNALTGTVDSVGNTWTWTRDLRGRETSRTDPDSGTTSTTYDDANNVLTTTDSKGQVLVYTYDALNRKTGQWLTSTTAPGYQLAYWTYDTIAKGRLGSSTRWRNADKYTVAVTGYDDAYRSLGEAVTLPAATGTALATTWTTGTTYNADGSVATTTYPAVGSLGAETVTNTYDSNGFQLTAAGLDTYVAGTTYQPWGDVLQRTLGANNQRVQVTTDEYASTHRPSTLSTATEHAGTPGTFDEQFSQKYNWTPGGTVSSIDTVHAGATTDSQCFSYDYLQRLTTAFTTTPVLGGCAATPSASTVGGPDAYWQTYTYDATGGRTGLVRHGLSGAADTSTTYTYPAAGATRAHTLTSTTTTGPGAGSGSYTYDADGNQSNATVNGLSTDTSFWETNRVKTTTVHAAGGDQATTYTYDAEDNELLRIGPSATTLYLGDTEITTNAGGAAVTSATRYYKAGDTVVASRTAPGTVSWLAYDDQNTADVAVDQTTLAVTVRKQDPFGNVRGTPAAWPNSRGFVGGTSEPGGLEHLGARLYDPSTGRFICDDPVTDSDNPQQLNGYAYAYNSPLTFTDPTGEWGWHSFMNVVQTVGAVATVLSFVPVIGEIAAPIAFVCSAISLGNDIYNWATGHGSWTDTLLDVASVATFGIGKVLKYAKPLLRARAFGRAARLAPKGLRGLGRINKRIRAKQLKQFGRTFSRWNRRNSRAGRGADIGGIYHTTCSWFVHGKRQHRYCH